MSRRVPLREIAHARAGDKGDISCISLWVRDPALYETVKAQVTAEAVKGHFGPQVKGDVRRFALDHLQGLNFVLHAALDGGVNGSLNLDGHGKSFSFILLAMTVEIE